MSSSSETTKSDEEVLLEHLKEFVPTIPPELTSYYMNTAGCSTPDARVQQLLALSAEKFVSDIANGALQFCKIRHQASKKTSGNEPMVLRTEDLVAALKDVGVNVAKPEYLVDTSMNE